MNNQSYNQSYNQPYNQWEIKEIVEVVSKGLNSVLMAKPDIPIDQLKKLAEELTCIYTDLHNKLKQPTNSQNAITSDKSDKSDELDELDELTEIEY